MSRVVFLLEEYSMKVLLDDLLPRLYPGLDFQCVHHEGKQDLEKSIPRKLRAWREPGVRFVILRDNDGADCTVLKQRLVNLCQHAGRPDSVVRIVCQELEAWYLADPEALAQAYDEPRLIQKLRAARFRNPDSVVSPSVEMEKILPLFQKVNGARLMAKTLSRERNTSSSFQALLKTLDSLAG